jgi:hypothetical protein
VAGARVALAEPGEGAVDDPVGHVVGADAEPRSDAGPEALQHDVGAGAERAGDVGLCLQVADDRLGSRVQGVVPAGRGRPHRVAVRRLDPDDPRAQAPQLARGVCARQVAREIDDEPARERFHRGPTY